MSARTLYQQRMHVLICRKLKGCRETLRGCWQSGQVHHGGEQWRHCRRMLTDHLPHTYPPARVPSHLRTCKVRRLQMAATDGLNGCAAFCCGLRSVCPHLHDAPPTTPHPGGAHPRLPPS